jgi:hypothetical protein
MPIFARAARASADLQAFVGGMVEVVDNGVEVPAGASNRI